MQTIMSSAERKLYVLFSSPCPQFVFLVPLHWLVSPIGYKRGAVKIDILIIFLIFKGVFPGFSH